MRYGLIENDVVVLVAPVPGGAGEWVALPPGVTNGARRHNGAFTAPPSGDYEWDESDGQWILTPAAQARAAALAQWGYRLERAEEYRARLGEREENTREETIGDVLDAILEFIEANPALTVPAGMTALLAERAAIKAEIPKPAPPDPE